MDNSLPAKLEIFTVKSILSNLIIFNLNILFKTLIPSEIHISSPTVFISFCDPFLRYRISTVRSNHTTN